MNKINPAPGQEWLHKQWPNSAFIIENIIADVNMSRFDSFKYKTEAFDWYDRNNQCFLYSSYWTYVGTPIKCEMCNEFCRQQCH